MNTPGLMDRLACAAIEPCGGAPLHLVDHETWSGIAQLMPAGAFVGLFAADGRAYALFDTVSGPVLVATDLVEGACPALSPIIPEAAWFERVAAEQGEAVATGAADTRPALCHAEWPRFIETEGDGYYQIGEGPVHGVIARPVHRRFTLDGARIVRLEHRHGYARRDLAGLMHGKSPRVAARFADRLSADAVVAHATAFARAAEAAADCPAPPRAAALRVAMLDLERVTTDLVALSAVLERAGHPGLATAFGRARDDIAAVAAVLFGHRLMMDTVIPGGLAIRIQGEALPALEAPLKAAMRLSGYVGGFGVRRSLGPAADHALARARSIRASAPTIIPAIASAPEGIIATPVPPVSTMGLGAAASARGRVYHWVRLHDGQIAAIAIIDPAAQLAQRLEDAAVGLGFEACALLSEIYALPPGAIDG